MLRGASSVTALVVLTAVSAHADEQALAELCDRTNISIRKDNDDPRIFADGIDVSEAIRTPEMGMMASAVSRSRAVRSRLAVARRVPSGLHATDDTGAR